MPPTFLKLLDYSDAASLLFFFVKVDFKLTSNKHIVLARLENTK
jgi:hypothetical protein